MEHVIEVEHLTKQFGETTALSDLSFAVPEGSIFGMLGPNGAGKTTTVRLLTGLLVPTNGTAVIFGRNVQEHADTIRQFCGVQTDTNLYEKLSARDNLIIWGRLYGLEQPKLDARIEALLTMFDLTYRQHDLVGTFSKGMRQKLAIARAILHDPQILFLDEPTAGLDPEAAFDVLQYLQTYVRAQGRTVFLCSHRLEEVEMLCREILIVDHGSRRAAGTISELVEHLWPQKRLVVEVAEITEPILTMLDREHTEYTVNQSRTRLMIMIQAREEIPQHVRRLVDSGARILRVQEEKHSLYDVYFHLVSEEDHATIRA